MATRRDAREWAVQLLFQLDLNPSDRVDDVLREFWTEHHGDPKARAFTETRVRGVIEHRDAIDALLRQYATNWTPERMAGTDRNVMRMALFEMRYCPDVPPAVAINEAVDLAKYFNSTGSGRFVNGVLDRARADLAAETE